MRASDGEIAAQGFALRKAVSRMGIQPAPGTPGPEQDGSQAQEDESTGGMSSDRAESFQSINS
jgi:hypothetical protein